MIIKKIEILHTRIPFVGKYEISSGPSEWQDCLITKIYTDDLIGYGESTTFSDTLFTNETPYTCIHIMRDLIIPKLLNKKIEKIEDLDDIFSHIRKNYYAKAGIEIAIWDLLAKYSNKPLFEFIGGEDKEIRWKKSVGIKDSIDELLEEVQINLELGSKGIKIKIKKGWDLEPIKAIREKFGDIEITADANSYYTLEDIKIFKEIDKYHITQIEQPLQYEDLYDHYKLRNLIETPICLDESISSVVAAKNALDIGCCDVVNIKLQKLGGIRNSLMVHDMCKAKKIPVWIGSMGETGVSNSAGLAFCTLSNVLYTSDIYPSGTYLKEDIIDPLIILNKNGNLELSKKPGLGFDLDEKQVKKITVNKLEFKP